MTTHPVMKMKQHAKAGDTNSQVYRSRVPSGNAPMRTSFKGHIKPMSVSPTTMGLKKKHSRPPSKVVGSIHVMKARQIESPKDSSIERARVTDMMLQEAQAVQNSMRGNYVAPHGS